MFCTCTTLTLGEAIARKLEHKGAICFCGGAKHLVRENSKEGTVIDSTFRNNVMYYEFWN